MRLYHYTCLLWLPGILREGFLANGTTADCPVKGANFTTSTSREAQAWGMGSAADKTQVRLTAEVPQDKLVTQRDLWKRYRIKRQVRDILDPHGQSKFWYIYLGQLPPTSIVAVELATKVGYQRIDREDQLDLCQMIADEVKRIELVVNNDYIKSNGEETWLLKQVREAQIA